MKEKKNTTKKINIEYPQFTRNAIKNCVEIANEQFFSPLQELLLDLFEKKVRPDQLILKKTKFDENIDSITCNSFIKSRIESLAFIQMDLSDISEYLHSKYGDDVYSPEVIADYLYLFFNLYKNGEFNLSIASKIIHYVSNHNSIKKYFNDLIDVATGNIDVDEMLLILDVETKDKSEQDVLNSYKLVVRRLKRAIILNDQENIQILEKSMRVFTQVIKAMGYTHFKNPFQDIHFYEGPPYEVWEASNSVASISPGIELLGFPDGTYKITGPDFPNGKTITEEDAEKLLSLRDALRPEIDQDEINKE
jgi:flagellin-specific chaperone FliS